MSDKKKVASENALNELQSYSRLHNWQWYYNGIITGDRAILASSITLLESDNKDHRNLADEIIQACLALKSDSLRIGITGVPGVGKSTFIDVFGTYLTSMGKKIAVLAIDPSSPMSGGSILGDKTRMSKLALDEKAFIRPTPSGRSTGGVAHNTKEALILCEAAGFDVIIVETVGVGQSETSVHNMTDFFMLLMLAGAGDQLQGIKRGIIEMADAIFITKSDSGNEKNSLRARAEFISALHLFPLSSTGWEPRVETLSSLLNRGVEVAWQIVTEHNSWMKSRNLFEAKRENQDIQWMHEALIYQLRENLLSDKNMKAKISNLEKKVRAKKLSPFKAVREIIASMPS